MAVFGKQKMVAPVGHPFLMNNPCYRIELFTGWLFNTRHAWFREHMPLCARGGGGQMWLRKLAR